MGKEQEYMRGRADGLDLALKIVKEGGAEALEEEIAWRGNMKLHPSLAMREFRKAAGEIYDRAGHDGFIMGLELAACALHDMYSGSWGEDDEEFGPEFEYFLEIIENATSYVKNGEATLDDYRKDISERIRAASITAPSIEIPEDLAP